MDLKVLMEAKLSYKHTLGLTCPCNLTASVVIDSKPAPIPTLATQNVQVKGSH